MAIYMSTEENVGTGDVKIKKELTFVSSVNLGEYPSRFATRRV